MDDVDAMFRDLTSATLPSRPSASFVTASLTSELTSLNTPGAALADGKARPSPVSFNIHEDTELIRVSSVASTSFVSVREDTALIDVRKGQTVAVYQDGDDDEDDVVLQTDEAISARAAVAGGGDKMTPTSTASTGTYRGASLLGLTPIMETSRESDASSLSNVSMRSTSSVSSTRSAPPPSSARSSSRPSPSHVPVARPSTADASETLPSSSCAPINPLASSIQALILSDLNVASSAGVTVEAGPAPSEVTELMGEEGGEGMDVDVGSWWLRVEGRKAEEDVDEGDGPERRRMAVCAVTDMNSGAQYALHVHRPRSLWEQFMSSVVASRIPATSQGAFLLVSSSHAYDDAACSLVPAPAHATLTLAALLRAYGQKGQTLPPALVAFYLHSLLHSLALLAASNILHCALTPSALHLPSDVLPADDWQADLPGLWLAQGLALSSWTSAVDLAMWDTEDGDWRAADVRGAARVLLAMFGVEARMEDVAQGKARCTGRVGGAEGSTVVRRLWTAGGGADGLRVMIEVRCELEAWMQGEAGARARQVKRLLCEQSVMLSSL